MNFTNLELKVKELEEKGWTADKLSSLIEKKRRDGLLIETKLFEGYVILGIMRKNEIVGGANEKIEKELELDGTVEGVEI